MNRSAVLSPCGRYRFRLGRRWGDGPAMVFIMLNPSTADADLDDPTIRRCIGFARRENHDAIDVVNLSPLRATDPSALVGNVLPYGVQLENSHHIATAIRSGGVAIAAWGAAPDHRGMEQVRSAVQMVKGMGYPLGCLGVTKSRQPRHPLYLRADQPLQVWP